MTRIGRKTFPSAQKVSYAAARSQLVSGDLLFCSGRHPLSQMIQKATDSVWSHVAFVLRLSEIDRVMVMESVESQGVRTIPLSKYLEDYDNEGHGYDGGLVLARHPDFAAKATANVLRAFSERAVDLFGYPYDRDEIAKITFRIVAQKLNIGRRNAALKRDKEYICSEYVEECFSSIGIDIPYKGGFIAPADFADQCDLIAVLQSR